MELTALIKCLKQFKFSDKQINTDVQVVSPEVINKASNDKLELVEITQPSDTNLVNALLGENNKENNKIRDGLGNKFILYKPNTVSSVDDDFSDDDLSKFMRSHAGLYYCDGKQNIYQLSPDYNFYNIVKELLLNFNERINDLENQKNTEN